MVGTQARAYDELAGRRGAARGARGPGRGGARRGRGQARGGRRQPRRRRSSSRAEAEAAKAVGRRARRGAGLRARRGRAGPRRATYASSSRREREKARIEERLRRLAAAAPWRGPAPRPPRSGRSVGSDRAALLQMPVGGGITSPFGYRTHPIYGYWGLHDGTDFGGGCGQPIARPSPGRVDLVVLERRLRQPADHRPRRPRRRRRRDDLQPRVAATPSAPAPRSSAARSSATSATPAGPPPATCTSR